MKYPIGTEVQCRTSDGYLLWRGVITGYIPEMNGDYELRIIYSRSPGCARGQITFAYHEEVTAVHPLIQLAEAAE